MSALIISSYVLEMSDISYNWPGFCCLVGRFDEPNQSYLSLQLWKIAKHSSNNSICFFAKLCWYICNLIWKIQVLYEAKLEWNVLLIYGTHALLISCMTAWLCFLWDVPRSLIYFKYVSNFQEELCEEVQRSCPYKHIFFEMLPASLFFYIFLHPFYLLFICLSHHVSWSHSVPIPSHLLFTIAPLPKQHKIEEKKRRKSNKR